MICVYYIYTGLLAYQHMYSSQAVTAEGLFRSALDQFKLLGSGTRTGLSYEAMDIR